GRAGVANEAARLDPEGVVQPRRHARHRDSLLPRPSPPDAARAQKDDRRRRGNGGGLYAHSAPRSRPCSAGGLSVAPPAPLAGAVLTLVEGLPPKLSAKTTQTSLHQITPAVRPAEAP